MSAGLQNQIENKLTAWFIARSSEPHQRIRKSHKRDKQIKHRCERRRARQDPEAADCYRRYCGWEW